MILLMNFNICIIFLRVNIVFIVLCYEIILFIMMKFLVILFGFLPFHYYLQQYAGFLGKYRFSSSCRWWKRLCRVSIRLILLRTILLYSATTLPLLFSLYVIRIEQSKITNVSRFVTLLFIFIIDFLIPKFEKRSLSP